MVKWLPLVYQCSFKKERNEFFDNNKELNDRSNYPKKILIKKLDNIKIKLKTLSLTSSARSSSSSSSSLGHSHSPSLGS